MLKIWKLEQPLRQADRALQKLIGIKVKKKEKKMKTIKEKKKTEFKGLIN
jgi:hypothetical protein